VKLKARINLTKEKDCVCVVKEFEERKEGRRAET
jgi:hypothetical protein